jgi:hypothetical protein
VLCFHVIFQTRQATKLTHLIIANAIMLLAFFLLSPIGVVALVAFARRVHPVTGQIAGDE